MKFDNLINSKLKLYEQTTTTPITQPQPQTQQQQPQQPNQQQVNSSPITSFFQYFKSNPNAAKELDEYAKKDPNSVNQVVQMWTKFKGVPPQQGQQPQSAVV